MKTEDYSVIILTAILILLVILCLNRKYLSNFYHENFKESINFDDNYGIIQKGF